MSHRNHTGCIANLVIEGIDPGVEPVAVSLGVPQDVAVRPAGHDPLDLVVECAVASQAPFWVVSIVSASFNISHMV